MSISAIVTMVAVSMAAYQRPSVTPPVSKPRPESHVILDLVLADWLKESPNLTRSEPPLLPGEAILLDPRQLPKGYQPRVAGRRIIVSANHPGEPLVRVVPPEQQIDANLKISRHVLYLDSIEIKGDVATVKIADDRHNNLGGSGATYEVRRTPKGWGTVKQLNLWQS